jgi:hypothetical protein
MGTKSHLLIDSVDDAATPPRGRRRWEDYADRYWTFRYQASLALAANYKPEELDAAADELGNQKGAGPTIEEAAAAIKRAHAGVLAFQGSLAGRPADEGDLSVSAGRAVSPQPKRKK